MKKSSLRCSSSWTNSTRTSPTVREIPPTPSSTTPPPLPLANNSRPPSSRSTRSSRPTNRTRMGKVTRRRAVRYDTASGRCRRTATSPRSTCRRTSGRRGRAAAPPEASSASCATWCSRRCTQGTAT